MAANQVVHIIDDDVDVRQSLALSAQYGGGMPSGYTSRALAFLKALPGAQDGCVITDIRMPDMDGLELQRRLNELKAGFSP
jgi:two-component system response regulator FixJ